MVVSTCICAKTLIIAIHFEAIDFSTLWALPPKKQTNIEPFSGSVMEYFQADHFCRLGSVQWRPVWVGRAEVSLGEVQHASGGSGRAPNPPTPPSLPVTRFQNFDQQNGFVPVGKWRRHWPIRRPEDVFTTSGEVRCSTTDPDLPKTPTGHSLTDSKLTFLDRTNQNLTNSKKTLARQQDKQPPLIDP